MKVLKCIALVMTIFWAGQLTAQNLHIIPEPYQIEKGNGSFELPKSISIYAPSSANEVATQIVKQLELVTGETVKSNQQNASIQLSIVKDEKLATEGYALVVQKNGIQIKANSNAGLFYGWQTLQQIMPTAIYAKAKQANTNWQIPYVSIVDKPRFEWRGMMLDVSRHFFSKADVKVFIDDMARY